MAILNECAACGGSLQKKILPYYDQPWGDQTYRFEKVPALVCVACGEIYFEATVSQAMDKALEDTDTAKPKRFVQLPVLELTV